MREKLFGKFVDFSHLPQHPWGFPDTFHWIAFSSSNRTRDAALIHVVVWRSSSVSFRLPSQQDELFSLSLRWERTFPEILSGRKNRISFNLCSALSDVFCEKKMLVTSSINFWATEEIYDHTRARCSLKQVRIMFGKSSKSAKIAWREIRKKKFVPDTIFQSFFFVHDICLVLSLSWGDEKK